MRGRLEPRRGGRADSRVHPGPDGADSPSGDADPVARARGICLEALAAAPRTRAQLAATLHRRGVPEDVAAAVLGRFTEVGLIDDAAFAEAWVRSRHTGRGLAKRALAHELRTRGVESEVLDTALDGLSSDEELATARRLAARKLAGSRGLAAPVRLRRVIQFLARKGYPPQLAFRVARETLEAEGQSVSDLDLDAMASDAEAAEDFPG
jgi:regulatory protein